MKVEAMNQSRKMVYSFLKLSYPKRIEIAYNLNLWDESFRNLDEGDFTKAIFELAQKKVILDKLYKDIEEMYRKHKIKLHLKEE